jgi:membrane-associated phospholipid phosphatase
MTRCAGVALVAAVLYAALGLAVAHGPPSWIDLAGRVLAGHAVREAWIFTASCLFTVLVTLGSIGAVVAFFVRGTWRDRIVYAILTTLVSWQVSNVLKDVFQRPRPSYWHLVHETSWSYSSGHAMFATIVYWLWAYFVWKSALPCACRFVVAPLLALWGCGVIWSRLALGAHYVTDLIGGVLLGIAMLAIASTVRRAIAGARSPGARSPSVPRKTFDLAIRKATFLGGRLPG